MSGRREEIAANLDAVRRRIRDACTEAGRPEDDVSLVVVTKFFPASDVRILADLGVRDVGENRHQEAAAKVEECADLDLTWHFIGGLQSNKAAAVASYADVVESVDRAKLLKGLQRGAHDRGVDLDVLLQVSLDPPGREGRSGVAPGDLAALAAAVADHPDATSLSAGMSADLEAAVRVGATHVRVGSAILGPRPVDK